MRTQIIVAIVQYSEIEIGEGAWNYVEIVDAAGM